jgi:hypothetical protein
MAEDGPDHVERNTLAQQGRGGGVAEHMGPLRRSSDSGARKGAPHELRDRPAGREGPERRVNPKEDVVVGEGRTKALQIVPECCRSPRSAGIST